MIAPTTATAETMKRALAYTIAALSAASELDLDRSDDDRTYFARERDVLAPFLKELRAKDRSVEDDELDNSIRFQARVSLGDVVLDRGVIDSKERMKIELKRSNPEAADQVFGKRVSDTTRAPILIEPSLVSAILARLEHAPDFSKKATIRTDLEKRVKQQNACIQDRTSGEAQAVALRSALSQSIRFSSDALYGLEKRLLDRFTRDLEYVRKFFFDVSSPRRTKEENTVTPPIPEPSDG
jgi:hypothetical protein